MRQGVRLFKRDSTTICCAVVATGVLFGVFLSLKGIPVLRHDWAWDARGSFFPNTWSSLGGWQSFGIGVPRAYPQDFLIAILNAGLFRVFGSFVLYVATACALGCACALGGAYLARSVGATPIVIVAAGVFATFNPWVYNKVVAGHLYMVLAYGATMLAIAEMNTENPSARRLTLFVLLTAQQLQFFVPVGIALAVWTIVRRQSKVPLIFAALACSPSVVGILLDQNYLLSIPYTTTWQSNASVAPVPALLLSGYYAGYALALEPLSTIAAWAVLLCALVGCVASALRYGRPTLYVTIAFGLIWLFCTGDKGPLGGGYLWLVNHIPQTGLYRELYDAVAFLAIGLIVACARSATIKPVAYLYCIGSVCFVITWCFAPPSRYWVAANEIPGINIMSPENTRYALFPALQPLSLDGRGSGLDPHAYELWNNVSALNTPQISFPESAALVAYQRSGDARWLAAMSVSQIVSRSYLHTNASLLGPQVALPLHEGANPGGTRNLILTGFQPEMAVGPVPLISSLPVPLWETGIFIGDTGANNFKPARPLLNAVSAAQGWVDLRFSTASDPELAQGFGGTITTAARTGYPLDPGRRTLVSVSGTMRNEAGAAVARDTRGYRWIAAGNSVVYCHGTCVIVGQAKRIPPTRFRSLPQLPVEMSQPASWLAFADVPPEPRVVVRYNVRYDRHWIALLGNSVLPHVEIDSTFNGWIVPRTDRPERIVVVEWVAALQFVCIALASIVIGCAGAFSLYQTCRRRVLR